MEASIHFLLWWRKLIVEEGKDWLKSYLTLFNAYIKLGVTFEDLNTLEFYIFNSEKTSRMKVNFELPPTIKEDDSNEVPEVIMVTWKK